MRGSRGDSAAVATREPGHPGRAIEGPIPGGVAFGRGDVTDTRPVTDDRPSERTTLAGSLCVALPGLVVFLVLARLLESPILAAGVLGALVLATLPGMALYRLLRPAADPLERTVGGITLGLPFMTLVFIAWDQLGLRSVALDLATCTVTGLILFKVLDRRVDGRSTRALRTPAGSWVGLAAVIAIAGAMYLPPSLSAGARLDDGSIGFVKNFGFDFMRHLANTAATVRGPLPPHNLFLDGRTVSSYWLYYPGPAMMARALGEGVELARVLQSYNFIILCLVLGFLASRMSRGWGGALAGGAGVAVFWAASSLRGVAQLLPGLGPLILGEEKFVFTVPLFFGLFMGHHLVAILLLLLVMTLYRPSRAGITRAGAIATGCLLPIIFVMSPFIGAVAAGWFGAYSLWSLAARRGRRRVLTSLALAVLPGLVGMTLYIALFGTGFDPGKIRMVEIHFDGHLHNLLPMLLVSMGPLLALAVAGVSRRRLRTPEGMSTLILSAVSMVLIAFLVVEATDVEATAHEVATKSGMVLMIALSFFASAGIARLLRTSGMTRPILWGAAGLLLAAGLVNSVAYVVTYSDLSRARTISAGDWEAVRWMRRNLPEDATIVVNTSMDYGPKNYSFVAPLAERQVFRGTKGISFASTTMVRETDDLYRGNEEILRKWMSRDSRAEWYVYCGAAEKLLNPRAIEALDAMSDLLEEVYARDGVKIYRMRRESGSGRRLDGARAALGTGGHR